MFKLEKSLNCTIIYNNKGTMQGIIEYSDIQDIQHLSDKYSTIIGRELQARDKKEVNTLYNEWIKPYKRSLLNNDEWNASSTDKADRVVIRRGGVFCN